jgi:hypothetical protein
LAAAGTLFLGALAMAGSARGDGGGATFDTAAWWYKPSQKGVTAPAPPTVPADGLLVQGQPDGASAIAAVRFTLAAGQGSPILTLAVADEKDSPDSPPVLAACLAGSAWSGSGQQQWESAPNADCTASVQGLLSDDKKSYTFAVSPLVQDNLLDIVLVPGTVTTRPAPPVADPTGGQVPQTSGSTFSVAFNKPTDASLTTTAGFDSSSSFAPPPEVTDPGTSDLPLSLDAPIADPVAGAAFTPALPAAQQGRTATAPARRLATQANVVAASNALQDRRGVAALVLLLGAVAAMFVNREPVPAPRRLGPLAGRALATEEPAVAAEPGGVGRFARPRVGSPPRL